MYDDDDDDDNEEQFRCCRFVQRQVGFDKQRRPVVYACFAQAACSDTMVHDTVVHLTHLFENAKRTMTDDVSKWVFVMDCTGASNSRPTFDDRRAPTAPVPRRTSKNCHVTFYANLPNRCPRPLMWSDSSCTIDRLGASSHVQPPASFSHDR